MSYLGRRSSPPTPNTAFVDGHAGSSWIGRFGASYRSIRLRHRESVRCYTRRAMFLRYDSDHARRTRLADSEPVALVRYERRTMGIRRGVRRSWRGRTLIVDVVFRRCLLAIFLHEPALGKSIPEPAVAPAQHMADSGSSTFGNGASRHEEFR